ncbi:unnamed protein product [Nezara viridula]|uniref:Uncharacterized protein n=1 Tax=Nezara viridula TaxID=85310 RepID=A0A9P0H2V3_NEZVI|nr:unnamed protein product [Nezara viridula]
MESLNEQNPVLLQYFKGHTGSITSLCFSPSGKNLASSSEDNSFLVWNLAANTASLRYKAKVLPVTYVTYSPFGTHIASAQGDFVRIWVSSVQGKSIEFKPHLGTVRSVEFSRDGEKLLTSSNDKCIKIWVTSRRRFFSSCTGHTNWVRIAKYSPDNKMIVSCSDDRTIRLWDPLTSKSIHTFNEVKGIPKYVTFHPSGTCFGAAMSHSVAKLYDVRNMKLLQYYACHSLPVNSIAFHPSGSFMITGSEDTTNKVIDLLEGRVILTLEAHSKPVTAVAFSKSGDHFATGSDDKNVFVWKSNLEAPVVVEETKRPLRESVANNTETKRPKICVKTSNLNISSSGIEDIYSVKDYEDTSSSDVERQYNAESYSCNPSNVDQANLPDKDEINSLNEQSENITKEVESVNSHLQNPAKDDLCSKCSSDSVLSLMESLTFENESLRKRMDLLEEKLAQMEYMMKMNNA